MNNDLFKIGSGYCAHMLTRYNGDEKSVYIPDGVDAIAAGAFPNSPNTEEIFIPATVKTVNSRAFYGCASLKRIYFLGTEKIELRAKAFDSLPSPLEIIYSGTLENWLGSSQKYTEEQSEYDGGWGGGAPGVYTYVSTCYPMEHELGERFTYKIKCLADGTELLANGKREEVGRLLVSSPYDK